jgi:hypothetical protein
LAPAGRLSDHALKGAARGEVGRSNHPQE